MHSGNRPSRTSVISHCKHPAWVSMLFIFLAGFIFQGCVIHDHNRGHRRHSSSITVPAPITFTFTKRHRHLAHNYYHKHPHHHGKKHTWKKKWRHKRKSHLHRDIQMQAVPYDLARQLPYPPRGTRYIYDSDQVLLINVKTRRVLDFINISVSQPAPPRTVDRMPSYEAQHPSYTHQPPTRSRAYEVAQGKPFTEGEHPSSHGQGHRANKGSPYIGDDHPSSHGKGHKGNKGKPDMDEDHPSYQTQDHRKNKGKPDISDDHPSHHAKNDPGHGQQSDRGKPLWGDQSSSDHGKKTNKHRDGRLIQKIDHPPSKGKGKHGEQKDGPPEDKGRPTDHAKVDKGNRGEPQQSDHGQQGGKKGGHQKDKERPSKGKGKQKNTFADSSQQEDASMQSSSPSKHKGKLSKRDRSFARGRSAKEEDTAQFQSNSTHEENAQVAEVEKSRGKEKSKGSINSPKKNRVEPNSEPAPSMVPMEQESPSELNQTQQEIIQVAKIEKARGKGNSKGSGRTHKMKRGQREQQAEIKAALTQQEPAPSRASSQTTATASISPSIFDANQRSIIQSYYQKSGSRKSGKGRGKKSKRNKTSSVSKNDILTQSTEPLPRNLESQLPPSPPNTQRVLYNQQVVLIERGTNRVLDAINVNN